jgi:hypothetical protein
MKLFVIPLAIVVSVAAVLFGPAFLLSRKPVNDLSGFQIAWPLIVGARNDIEFVAARAAIGPIGRRQRERSMEHK